MIEPIAVERDESRGPLGSVSEERSIDLVKCAGEPEGEGLPVGDEKEGCEHGGVEGEHCSGDSADFGFSDCAAEE